MTTPDPTTEEKIKNAARELFHQKGYDATKTRDIAEAAGINLALLNYYFRSKKKLFEIIMLETIEVFFEAVVGILSDTNLSPHEVIRKLTVHYIDMLGKEPDLPLFILGEMRNNPSFILENIIKKKNVKESPLLLMLRHSFHDNPGNPTNPAHILLNFISMTIFPFAAKPIIQELFDVDENTFIALMEERKNLIPVWIDQLLPPHLFPQSQQNES